MRTDLRNIAIIAHVDHGKTTLVDALLKQSHAVSGHVAEGTTIMDSNELERERGITIFAKNASIMWKGVKVNIVDTPGHADFGGEVERIMHLVDGCLLLVDAKEGPMPQTKFVLKKAIEAGHKILLVVNKIDKKDARPSWVVDRTFDLFIDLGASDEQAHFPVFYASAVNGLAGLEPDMVSMKNIEPLLDGILKEVPGPEANDDAPLQISVVNMRGDAFKGTLAIGRVIAGKVKRGQQVVQIDREGKFHPAKISTLLTFGGLGMTEIGDASSGDIIAISGIDGIQIGETIADAENPKALPVLEIEEPTVKMQFSANTSPFAGEEGQFCTSRNVEERLMREVAHDVALRVEKTGDGTFEVAGRGELHLAILIEKMRREGYELQVSKPQVIVKVENGKKLEPFELVSIEVPESFSGVVIEHMGKRRGEMKDMRMENGTAFLDFEIPTRGLIGYRSEFLTDTKGNGILNSLLLGFKEWAGEVDANAHGSLVSMERGETMSYSLLSLQERGRLFVRPQVQVYPGMIIGQNAKVEDMDVNPCKEKKMTNIRSKGEGVVAGLEVARELSLEQAIEYLGDDELLEVTPKNLRLRKAILDMNMRRRAKHGENGDES
ncbi:MAG: translational GTPase TypA [Patescibacteria group bacterium]